MWWEFLLGLGSDERGWAGLWPLIISLSLNDSILCRSKIKVLFFTQFEHHEK